MKSKRINKYEYNWIVQQWTGRQYGWEDVYTGEDRKDARARLREYRENQPEYPARMIQRRELNPDYPGDDREIDDLLHKAQRGGWDKFYEK